MQPKPRSIELVNFEEEPLPSGRKLLHCIFQNKFGDHRYRYKWTALWGGQFGVERVFFKALDIEQFNDPNGAWSRELHEAAKEIPELKQVFPPVTIDLAELEEGAPHPADPTFRPYRIAISISSASTTVLKEVRAGDSFILIGHVAIRLSSMQAALSDLDFVVGASDEIEIHEYEVLIDEPPYVVTGTGVKIYIWLEQPTNRAEYRAIARQVKWVIWSFIREKLADYRALKKGFEQTRPNGEPGGR